MVKMQQSDLTPVLHYRGMPTESCPRMRPLPYIERSAILGLSRGLFGPFAGSVSGTTLHVIDDPTVRLLSCAALLDKMHPGTS